MNSLPASTWFFWDAGHTVRIFTENELALFGTPYGQKLCSMFILALSRSQNGACNKTIFLSFLYKKLLLQSSPIQNITVFHANTETQLFGLDLFYLPQFFSHFNLFLDCCNALQVQWNFFSYSFDTCL